MGKLLIVREFAGLEFRVVRWEILCFCGTEIVILSILVYIKFGFTLY